MTNTVDKLKRSFGILVILQIMGLYQSQASGLKRVKLRTSDQCALTLNMSCFKRHILLFPMGSSHEI